MWEDDTLTAESWIHVAVDRSKQDLTFWVNGKKIGTKTMTTKETGFDVTGPFPTCTQVR
jgi:hypothetical protein